MNDEINLTSTAQPYIFQAQAQLANRQWTIPARTWGDLESARACALLVHGLGAHSGWFEAFAQRLSRLGICCMSYDQIGFGKRRQETFHSKEEWLADLKASYQHLKGLAGDKPTYLFGNSMGGVVALKGVQDLKPDALILTSPGFDGHPVTFNLPYKVRALIAAIFTPDADVVLPYTVNDITPTQSIRDFLEADPLRRFTISARMGLELLKLTLSTKSSVKSVPCPLFMATAGVEKIVDNKLSQRIFENLTAPSKTHKVLADSWHDLMFDPHLDELIAMLSDWLASTAPVRV